MNDLKRFFYIVYLCLSLQLGLANYLGVPVGRVYAQFEMVSQKQKTSQRRRRELIYSAFHIHIQKRAHYCEKLLENYCYSPQSWTASPGVNRRQQLFGSESESPRVPKENGSRTSFWRKLQRSVSKFGKKKKKSKDDQDTHSESHSEVDTQQSQPSTQLDTKTQTLGQLHL